MKILLFIILVLLINSCSLVEQDSGAGLKWDRLDYVSREYRNHLSGLAQNYVKSLSENAIVIDGESKKYLEDIREKIFNNNELFFNKKESARYYVVKDKIPFFFSLPGSWYFFSSGLLEKFIKHEDLMVVILTYESIRNQRGVYEKKMLVPTGFVSTERMLAVVKVPVEIKHEINKWAYYLLKRAGHDEFSVLIWLQIQNKNALEFNMLLGDAQNISSEEFMFKQFIVKEGLVNKNNDTGDKNSSKGYYNFMQDMRKKVL